MQHKRSASAWAAPPWTWRAATSTWHALPGDAMCFFPSAAVPAAQSIPVSPPRPPQRFMQASCARARAIHV
eukprot:213543-Lingulodinium_polyedra.AAC.1